MAFKFETLQVWNKSLDLSLLVQEIVISFPHYEIYNLSNQIRRAADSVVKDQLDKVMLSLLDFCGML